jgi:hypothetical protein
MVRASRVLPAAARRVYDVLADYRLGHRLILPARVFQDVEVVRGGRGAGTLLRFGMRSFGNVKRFRVEIEEPEPGRVLSERDLDGNGAVTTFTVDPAEGDHSAVTIETRWTPMGAGALVERLLAPAFLRRVYAEELANLEKVATGAL